MADATKQRPSVEDCIRTVRREYEPSSWHGETDAIRKETVRLIRAGALIRDVAASGVELDDPRIGYVTVQIDRETWREIREVIDDG